MNRAELEKRAAALGIKPETLRMRMYRESLRKRPPPKPAELETFGMKLVPKFRDDVRETRRRLTSIMQRVTNARAVAEKLRRSALPVPIGQLETIVGALQALEEKLAGAMPRSLCPYCKGLDRIQDDCRGCGGSGLASEAQWAKAPVRLRELPIVLVDGKERDVDDFAKRSSDPFE
jgi:hypothetical protein